MTQEVLKLALEALKWCHGGEPCGTAEAITAIEEALAQPEQEPVIDKSAAIRIATTLGWTPPRTWVELTDGEIDELHGSPMNLEHSGALKWVRIIEARLKQKNGYAEEKNT